MVEDDLRKLLGTALSRRRLIAGAGVGIGAFLTACNSKSTGNDSQQKEEPPLEYNIKSKTVIAPNGGQSDWARHDPELITYCRYENGAWAVCTVRSDGSDNKALTIGKQGAPVSCSNPGWHPSGKWITFQGQKPKYWGDAFLRHSGMGGFCDAWVMDASGQRYFNLTNLPYPETQSQAAVTPLPGVLMPKFSPSGKKIHWTQWRTPADRGTKWWSFELKVADFIADSGNPRIENIKTVKPGPGTFYEAFNMTPDEKKLIVAATLESDFPEYGMDLYLVDIDTAEWQNVTNSPHIWEEGCKISPDGKKILFGTNEGQESQIQPKNAMATRSSDFWIMDIDGSNEKRLTWFSDPDSPDFTYKYFHAAVVAWAPDQKRFSACITNLKTPTALSTMVLEFE